MPTCAGTSEDHCCWLNGDPCPFLEENTVSGRRWACALRRELGSWGLVHLDQRYLKVVGPAWRASSARWAHWWDLGYRCGDWPFPGVTCAECGVSGG